MARYARVKPHLTEEQIGILLKEQQGFWRIRHLLIILSAMRERTTAQSISSHVNLSVHRVRKIISTYNREGASFFERKGQGGRKYGYMSIEAEEEFLKSCEPKAIAGEYTTVADIKKAFEEKVGKQVAKGTIYNLLNRHNWRKLTPRPSHPKKDVDKQVAFKKTLLPK